MIPRPFDYFAPRSLTEATGLLAKYGEDAKLLGGGQSLLPIMKLRLASPKYLIDLSRIAGLSYIKELGGEVAIGAMTTDRAVEKSPLLAKVCPILPEAASLIADPLIRNRGTIGGNICHYDPAGDLPPVMLALSAKMRAVGPSGERVIEAKDFFVDTYTTSLKYDEILTEIVLRKLSNRTGSVYLKFSRRPGDFAIVGVAAVLTPDERGICRDVSIAQCGLSPRLVKPLHVEEQLKGKSLDEETITKASQLAGEGVELLSDFHASARYRSAMAKVFTKRSLLLALDRARAGR